MASFQYAFTIPTNRFYATRILNSQAIRINRSAADAGLLPLYAASDFADGVIAFEGLALGDTVLRHFSPYAATRVLCTIRQIFACARFCRLGALGAVERHSLPYCPTSNCTGLPMRLSISTRVSIVNLVVFLFTRSDTRGRDTIRISAASACFK